MDALVQAPTVGWVSLRTLLETAAGLVLLGLFAAGLGQGVAFTTMYVAAGTGVAADDQGAASAIASTAQQLGGSVGLAALVGLLSERAVALGGTGVGLTGQPAGVMTGALHVTFAAQAGIAVLGAVVALGVIGGPRPRRRRAERDRRTERELARQAA